MKRSKSKSSIRPQGRWLVKHLSKQCSLSEREVEDSLNELIDHGHMRVLTGAAPDGSDLFECIVKNGLQS